MDISDARLDMCFYAAGYLYILYLFVKSVADWQKVELIQGKIIGYKYIHIPKKKFYSFYDKHLIVPVIEYSVSGNRNIIGEIHDTSIIKSEGTALKFHAVKKADALYAYAYRNFFFSLVALAILPSMFGLKYNFYGMLGVSEKVAMTVSFLLFPLAVFVRLLSDVKAYGVQNKWLLDLNFGRHRNYLIKGSGWIDGQQVSYLEISDAIERNRRYWRIMAAGTYILIGFFIGLGILMLIAAALYYSDFAF